MTAPMASHDLDFIRETLLNDPEHLNAAHIGTLVAEIERLRMVCHCTECGAETGRRFCDRECQMETVRRERSEAWANR